jgi:hypothetical protein
MTVRVIALESCSATHLLSVSRKRSQSLTELLHEDPQLQLGVGLNFTHTRQELSIQVAQLEDAKRPSLVGNELDAVGLDQLELSFPFQREKS